MDTKEGGMTDLEPIIEVVMPTGVPDADRRLLDSIRRYLGCEEAVNTIQLAGFLARDVFDPAQPVLAAKSGNDLVGVATLTPGFPLLLSHMESGEAIPALITAAIARELDLPGVMGPDTAALAFARHWAGTTGGAVRPGMAQRILLARSVRTPGNVPGTCRHMEPGDRSLLVSWFTAFNIEIEADHVALEEAASRGKAMLERLDERSGGMLWLDEGGAPVSVACFKAPTTNGIRIGPVFTPPEHRRHGYAAAVTAATTRLMLDRGFAFACLYTNAANATANHVYESIGYEFVAGSMQYLFSAQPTADTGAPGRS